MTNIMQMMQKAQKMKTKMAELQTRVQNTDVEGQAGSGLVTCVMSGKFVLKKIKIAPGAVNPADIEMLEDLVVAAVNDAQKKAEKLMGDETRALMQELGLPPNMDLPF